MSSRNVCEGRYVGTVHGRHVRRREPVPALLVGSEELFPPFAPYPDNGIAWLTLSSRVGALLARRPRYISKRCIAALDDLIAFSEELA